MTGSAVSVSESVSVSLTVSVGGQFEFQVLAYLPLLYLTVTTVG